MKKKEAISLLQWMYVTEERLTNVVSATEYRFIRRELDEVDLLEEIIAKSNLKFFQAMERDILRIIGLSVEEDSDI